MRFSVLVAVGVMVLVQLDNAYAAITGEMIIFIEYLESDLVEFFWIVSNVLLLGVALVLFGLVFKIFFT